MNTRICKNCKYFTKYEKLTYCGLIEQEYLNFDYDKNSKTVAIGVETLDDTGLEIALVVNENFGCVLFEEKEDSE